MLLNVCKTGQCETSLQENIRALDKLPYKRTFVHWIPGQERHKGWHESNLLMAAQATRAEAVEDSYLQVGARIRFAL